LCIRFCFAGVHIQRWKDRYIDICIHIHVYKCVIVYLWWSCGLCGGEVFLTYCCAAHCNTLQHIATHYSTLQRTATHCNTLQHTATHCNTLQHTATHCNTYATFCCVYACVCVYTYIYIYLYICRNSFKLKCVCFVNGPCWYLEGLCWFVVVLFFWFVIYVYTYMYIYICNMALLLFEGSLLVHSRAL